MASSRTRSQAVRRSLHLYIDPSSYTTTKAVDSSHTPSPGFGTNMSAGNDYYTSNAGVSDSTLFSVLCMYDFSSDDAGLLSFSKNEILNVVKCDNTGWWAAMRKDGPVVGWIPQAFVVQLSDDMTQRLLNVREEFRGYEYEAEQLYNSAPVSRILPLFETDSATTSPLPVYEENRVSLWRSGLDSICIESIPYSCPLQFQVHRAERATSAIRMRGILCGLGTDDLYPHLLPRLPCHIHRRC